MGVSRITRDGVYCDVAVLPDGSPAFVYLTDTQVRCERSGSGWTVPAPSGRGSYLRAAANEDGSICAVYQGQDNKLYVTIDGQAVFGLGNTYGQNVAVVYAVGKEFRVVVQRTFTNFQRVAIPTGVVLENIASVGTSQGVRQVLPDGRVVFGDDTHMKVFGKWTLHEYMTVAGWTVGQVDGTDNIMLSNGQDAFTVIPGHAYDPHIAVHGSQIYVTAWTPGGSVLATVSSPYPAAEVPGTPQPQPEPDPPTTEPPVSIPNHRDVVVAARKKYQSLPYGNRRAFAITNEVARQLAGEGVGLLSKPSGNNYNGFAVDVVIYKPGGEAFDILGSAGDTPEAGKSDSTVDVPQWGTTSDSPLDPTRWRPAVAAIPVPDPQPDPQPDQQPDPPQTDLSALEAKVEAQREAIKGLIGVIQALNSSINILTAAVQGVDQQVKTPRPVTLQGKVLGFGATFNGTVG